MSFIGRRAGPNDALVPYLLFSGFVPVPVTKSGRPIPDLRSDQAKEAAGNRTLFLRWQNSYAVRDGDWKLLYKGGTEERRNYDQIINRTELLDETCLFNLREDAAESRNLADSHPAVAARLQKLYDEWLDDLTPS